jgi:hydroxymethylpyrimidine pyrophosphatase-like HAD family hydrolase
MVEYDLDKKDVYVIGNEENDVSMITMFNGSAMKSCAEVVKKLNVKVYNQVYELVDEIATMNSFDS